MLKNKIALIALAALVALPLAALAQDEEPEMPYVYSTYFVCETTQQWLADMIVEQVYKPVYDAAVEDGTISAWGWLGHHTGGEWRRAIYRVAPTVDALLDGGDAIAETIGDSNPQAARKFAEICGSHVDYIWQSVTGSGGAGSIEVATAPAEAGVSMYMVCDMSRQERADELMEVLGAAWNNQVEAGGLVSWGWLAHNVGGKYRRLLTMRGADHKSVLAAWGEVIEENNENHKEAADEFYDICDSHQDYMWDMLH